MGRARTGSGMIWAALVLGLMATAPVSAQSAADSTAIRNAALDYAHGWYAGDAARMQRAVHPDLAKRMVQDRGGRFVLDQITARELVEITGSGAGRTDAGLAEVRILDISGGAATVRMDMTDFIEYMHIARWEDRWVIVNVLWQVKPR